MSFSIFTLLFHFLSGVCLKMHFFQPVFCVSLCFVILAMYHCTIVSCFSECSLWQYCLMNCWIIANYVIFMLLFHFSVWCFPENALFPASVLCLSLCLVILAMYHWVVVSLCWYQHIGVCTVPGIVVLVCRLCKELPY